MKPARRAVKVIAVVGVLYIGIVVLFESSLGYFQPGGQSTMIIATANSEGVFNPRVVARLDSDGQLYAAANHWPRAWYRNALSNPAVKITLEDGVETDYRALPVSGAEHDRVNSDNALDLVFRLLTGFPPRYFVRLDLP